MILVLDKIKADEVMFEPFCSSTVDSSTICQEMAGEFPIHC